MPLQVKIGIVVVILLCCSSSSAAAYMNKDKIMGEKK
jgi:hypothetical protein